MVPVKIYSHGFEKRAKTSAFARSFGAFGVVGAESSRELFVCPIGAEFFWPELPQCILAALPAPPARTERLWRLHCGNTVLYFSVALSLRLWPNSMPMPARKWPAILQQRPLSPVAAFGATRATTITPHAHYSLLCTHYSHTLFLSPHNRRRAAKRRSNRLEPLTLLLRVALLDRPATEPNRGGLG